MRAGGLSVYRIALALKVRRQSVEQILRRPHVAAMVEDFRTRLRAQRLLRDGAQQLLRELLRDGASEYGANPEGISCRGWSLLRCRNSGPPSLLDSPPDCKEGSCMDPLRHAPQPT